MESSSYFNLSLSSSTMEGRPNWLKLPEELMANILQRLSYLEILNSASKVCTTWKKICKDPAMWKVIDMRKQVYRWSMNFDIETLITKLVDLSCGELIDFSVKGGFEIIPILDYAVQRSSKMKRLYIQSCDHDLVSGGFIWAIKKLPQLEEFHLSCTYPSAKEIELIGQNCPLLKSFAMNQYCQRPQNDDTALAIANNMPGLRHLQVIGNSMTKIGLQAILNGCPHLESLDLRMCYYLRLGGKFGKVCMERIRDLKRPHDSMENHELHQEYDECDIYDHMYSSGYSDVDDSSDNDFYQVKEVSEVNNASKERDYEYDYDYEYYCGYE
ncbi:putative F-box/LRR-repeat protein 9 isoform X2 [Lactuca sativa]|nr:putative F-box/LRR-repeat protein 9 isoform X2 [Lactuca sativa]